VSDPAALPPPAFLRKIVARGQAGQALRRLPGPVVFTNGVFDVLHRGHATYLAQARSLGGSLVVAINTDASARRLGKGPERPLNNEQDRAAMLAALASVDLVTWFDEDTPVQLLGDLRPDIYVKGGDYDMKAIPEGQAVLAYGGRALAIDFRHDRSTTRLLDKVRRS